MYHSSNHVQIERVADASALRGFLRFPRRLYRGDRLWVAPPPGESERRLDTQRNPLWQHAERELWIARRGNDVVGTVAAIADRSAEAAGMPCIGRFGFWESVDDHQVAAALLETAAAWLRERGIATMRGPYNGAVTDEAGVLIAGFDTRPALWEARSRPYYASLLAALGFAMHDDVLAYEVALRGSAAEQLVLPRLETIAARAARRAIVLRELRAADWDREAALLCGLYNRTFASTPGHQAITKQRFADLARRLRPVIDPGLLLVAQHRGEPAGFVVGLRDLNPALAALGGRRDPVSLLRFRLTLARTGTVCVKMLGVLPQYRGRGVEALLMAELGRRARERGFARAELSLISARNLPMRRIAERLGARVVRRYRIFERDT